jgi:hypothetical protein
MEDKVQLIATALFGVEAVVARELKHLGYEDSITEDGKVTFTHLYQPYAGETLASLCGQSFLKWESLRLKPLIHFLREPKRCLGRLAYRRCCFPVTGSCVVPH